jgi:hypothetical protein
MPPENWCGYWSSLQVLLDLQAHWQDRIERRHRLLEDHGDLGAAHLAQLAFRHRQEVAPPPFDVAADMARLAHQPHDRS